MKGWLKMFKTSDKQRLMEWLSKKRYVKSSEIIKWGAENYSNRAMRNAQNLRETGQLRRLSKRETERIFGKTRELGYEVISVNYQTQKNGQVEFV